MFPRPFPVQNFAIKAVLILACTLGLVTKAAQAEEVSSTPYQSFTVLGDSAPMPEQAIVHPVTSPYFHEDSYITSDVRAWFLYHKFPNNIIGGGHAKVAAVQVRVALTDRLQFVAYKDGYLKMESGAVDNEGNNDVAAGIKWAFLQDEENDLHAAVGIGYQLAVGDAKVLQNDQELRIWESVNKSFGNLHVGATANVFIHTGDEGALGSSSRVSWHVHADYYLNSYLSPVVEFNGYHTLKDGNSAPLPFSGVDVANLGGGASEPVVTMGIGGELRPLKDHHNFRARAAFEFPLTDRNDLYGWRWTFSAIYQF